MLSNGRRAPKSHLTKRSSEDPEAQSSSEVLHSATEKEALDDRGEGGRNGNRERIQCVAIATRPKFASLSVRVESEDADDPA